MKRRETYYITWRGFDEAGLGLVVGLMIVGGIAGLCWFAQAAREVGSWQYNLTMALRSVKEALG